MADWASLSTVAYIRPYRHPSGSPPIREFEESTCAATAVIQYGDIVCFDTVVASASHRILRAPSSGGNSGNALQVGITSLVGVALQGSTSDGSTTGLVSGTNVGPGKPNRKITVALADRDTEFLGFLGSTGAGPWAASPSLIGTVKAVHYDRTAHRFYIDSTNSTAAMAAVKITDIPSESVGDSGGAPVIFKFLSSNASLAATQ